jgi:hypothetical protein
VYGFGAESQVEPWTNLAEIFKRNPTSANQNTVALSIKLPVDRLVGTDTNGNGNMLPAMQTASDPQRTIGFSSTELVDLNRESMRTLAFKAFGQSVAFYPDSDPATFDKRNVRDGHYAMWVPIHVVARTSAGAIIGGNADLETGPTKVRDPTLVANMVDWLTGRKSFPGAGFDVIEAEKKGGLTPLCAIHVTRTREGAPLEPFTPPQPCDCAFEAATPGTTPAECLPCQADTDCTKPGRGHCSYGYCEPG